MKVFINQTQMFCVAKRNSIAKTNSNIKKSVNFTSASSISRELARKGIRTEFHNNDFFARCAEQIVDLFENLFDKSALPSSIEYNNLPKDILGQYDIWTREVEFNYALNEMRSTKGLKSLAKKGRNFIIPDDFSSLHPAHTHVHEFAHSAHHANLNHNHYFGSSIMEKLRYTQVPTVIGRLITRFKLGNYALDKAGGMNEFMAERIAQDVCHGITEEFWSKNKTIDVGYSDIFSRKWGYRYSQPQAYLDYFTQQVWNGDIEEAINAAGKVEEYLAELDGIKVPVSIQVATERAQEKGGIRANIMNGISCFFESVTNKLDKRNQLIIRN